jgi:phosphate transport system protein
MRKTFDQQLELLSQELTHMGALCETAIASATESLKKRDVQLAKRAIAADQEIDQQEREIERLCLKLLLQQQPVARDLRQISSALKMITDMERIGDQAADISEIVTYMSEENLIQELDRIDAMARAASQMVTQSVDAYVKKDLDLAKKVIADDDAVDELFEEIKAELIRMIAGDPNCGEQALDFLMIAKYLERIGDHATNIAEWVEFSILGRHPEQDEIESIEDRQEPSER